MNVRTHHINPQVFCECWKSFNRQTIEFFSTKPHQHQKNNIEDWTNRSIENIEDKSNVSIDSTLGIIMTTNYLSMELIY